MKSWHKSIARMHSCVLRSVFSLFPWSQSLSARSAAAASRGRSLAHPFQRRRVRRRCALVSRRRARHSLSERAACARGSRGSVRVCCFCDRCCRQHAQCRCVAKYRRQSGRFAEVGSFSAESESKFESEPESESQSGSAFACGSRWRKAKRSHLCGRFAFECALWSFVHGRVWCLRGTAAGRPPQ